MRNFNTLIGRYDGADGMKTGFICASGFNLVATATRNGKRLIAVVLGAPSSPYRAAKAAGLLERGFHRGPLSWLSPSLGSVESLQPINATPPDLRDEMCGSHRKRPAAEEADDDSEIAELHAVEPAAEHRQGLGPAQGSARRRQGDRGVHRRGEERRREPVRQRPRENPAPGQGQEVRSQGRPGDAGRDNPSRASCPTGHRAGAANRCLAAGRSLHADHRPGAARPRALPAATDVGNPTAMSYAPAAKTDPAPLTAVPDAKPAAVATTGSTPKSKPQDTKSAAAAKAAAAKDAAAKKAANKKTAAAKPANAPKPAVSGQ